MAAQAGRDFALQINTTGSTYVGIAGGRTKSLQIADAMVDVTNSDSTGLWRELLAGGGVRQIAASLQGVFVDDAAFEVARAAVFSRTFKTWKLVIPDYGTFQGSFMITQLEFAGEYNGAVNYTIGLESSGEVTFTAA